MPKRKFYAKDRRKLKRRRWTSTAMTVGGLAALGLMGWFLYRKIVADAAPAPGQRKDWSGCLTPPDWVQPRPAYSCGQRVTSQTYYGEGAEAGVDSIVSSRTWTQGQWVYSLLFSDDVYEEGQLTEA